jgi:catechol 2,3-dioxygenase-like lactoylglutathione lyase family enzyme
VSDQITHQHVHDVIVEIQHGYTDKQYSNEWLIAPIDSARYSPRSSWRTPMVRGIKFVGVPVRSQDVSLKFYTEALGLKVVTDQPFTDKQRWIELLIPGAATGVALFTPEGHEKRIGEFQSIAFWCDDVFATAKVLKSKGVTFAQEPKNEPWGSIAVFKDPDGNQFALSSKVNHK